MHENQFKKLKTLIIIETISIFWINCVLVQTSETNIYENKMIF